jgi:D-glycero-alpha-D-manno-heptose 1-phosphate guanylyltransferase
VEAIILAGGLGTRLRSVVADLPKAMAPVNGKPFLAYLLDGLITAGFDRAILAVGYMSDKVQGHFGHRYRSLPLRYSVETEPLGTGGAIKSAMTLASASTVLVSNGDTYVELGYGAMFAEHERARSQLTIAAQTVSETGRYGALDIEAGHIRGFIEKGRSGPGSINAGVYLLSRELLDRYTLPPAFSFETDLLMPHVKEIAPLAFHTQGIFIDIGIPEDYARAQTLFPRPA